MLILHILFADFRFATTNAIVSLVCSSYGKSAFPSLFRLELAKRIVNDSESYVVLRAI